MLKTDTSRLAPLYLLKTTSPRQPTTDHSPATPTPGLLRLRLLRLEPLNGNEDKRENYCILLVPNYLPPYITNHLPSPNPFASFFFVTPPAPVHHHPSLPLASTPSETASPSASPIVPDQTAPL